MTATDDNWVEIPSSFEHCADWQMVDNGRFIVFSETDHRYYVADCVEHILSNIYGPYEHGREKIDLDDPEQLCISCGTCHYGEINSDACSSFRKPKPGLSKQEWKDILEKSDKENDLQIYYDNSVPHICIHGQALFTYVKRKQDLQAENNTTELDKGYTGHWHQTFVTARKGGG
jgi:hypothetical protein